MEKLINISFLMTIRNTIRFFQDCTVEESVRLLLGEIHKCKKCGTSIPSKRKNTGNFICGI